MSLLALGRNGRSQAGAEASGLDSLMGWAYTTIEFTLFLWSIAVGLAYDGLAALLTSRVYRAGAGAVLLYLLGTTLIELVTSGDGGPELLFFLRMAVFVYCVGYQVRALCDYTPVRVLLLLSGGYPLFRHGAAAIAEPFRDYAAMGPYAGVLLTFSAIYLATRSLGRHVGYFMDTYIKTYVLETRIDSLLRRVRGGGAHADEPSEESVSLLHAYLRARGGLLCTLSVAVYQYGLVMIPLLVLGGLGGVGAVCPSCGSSIASCTYDTDQRCPTITIVATNASAMAGVGVVSTVTLATLIREPSLAASHISSAFVLALFVGFAFQFGFCLSFGSANSAMCAMYCVLAIVTCGYNQTTLFTTASYCRLDPSWATAPFHFGAAGLARFPICNYCTPRRRWANLSAATYWRGFRDVSLSSGSQWAIPGGSRGQWPRFSDPY
ncbi:hypothetical protein EMIHUDRAFT_204944 [Emiliania huxleyi CCMP1516]|uniref:Uncharacterized protein n=2 Tax=Emiliania huxleyi TaxID=2903 RepID=A0A0D3JU72_EMIH1|nr:hypothetical protein EMIHUDRAFT_204944 [Emiliania huxleyi CCMP1516]EOD27057.1 hypothetical protein EMIHUDRAFT_204944 [Emiliania huxleyi CCMP1516]|eukprot:XP_005779486.1 hypothetical protein EMIHUDRAFT_204944 [Emiliania huxleyi CCMP1516]